MVRYDDYINAKIESTRRLVKFVDFATALVELTVGVLIFLLLYALLEHWVVRGGFSVAVRMVLFGLLVGGAGYFAFRRLWPLCVRAINPVYAAQTIEHGSPTMQNSLINLLLFRQRRSDISDAVFRTLEEQAAHGLTRAPIDSAVDRSHLIRLGYVLIAIVAAACLYKVLSPKDPLVAAERVLMPWADIVPASRVSISEIKPGVATISRGEFIDVTADVRGLDDDDAVVLRYTTDDGQVVGRAIPMKSGADRLQFSCRLADESDGPESVGVTRSLSYRLEAGDARSLDYPITVVPAASILVERVEYHYPSYTGYVDHTAEGVGDIHAIEGTRVTVHARANGTIRDANVDFDADGRRDLQMTASESKARATFQLELREDRQTPRHASYVLRFTNDEGRANHDPVKHSINVDRDIEPEADIRQPQEKARDVRLDEVLAVEVDAVDPDFGLSAVRLRGEAAGRPVFDQPMLKGAPLKHFAGQYKLIVGQHGLKAGDLVEYWVEASDNRMPKPNVTASEHKTLRIVSPNPAQQPQPNQIAQNDRQQPKPGEPQPGEQGQKNGKQDGNKQQDGGAAEQQPGGESGQGQGQQGQGEQGQGQQGEQGQGSGKDQAKDAQGGGSGDKSQGSGEKGEGQPGEAGQNAEGSGSSSSGQANEQKGQGKSGSQAKPGESGSNDQKQPSQGDQKGGDSKGGESSKGGAESKGGKPDAQQGDKSPGANQQSGEQQEQSGDDKSPVSSDGDNDAEAFDRIKKHMEQSGELKGDEASLADASKDNDSQEKGEQAAEQGQGDKEQGRQGDAGDKSQGSGEEKGEGKQGQEGQQSGEQKGEGKDQGQKGLGDKEQGKQRESGDKSQGGGEQKGEQGAKDRGAKPDSADGKSGDGEKGQQQSGEGQQGKQDGSQGQGAEKRGDQPGEKGQQKTNASDQKGERKSPDGQQTGSKGEADGGNEQENKESQGSPESQQGMKPGEKPEQDGSKDVQSKQGEQPAGASGKRKSDTPGEQGGDKTGDGEEGAGQKSPRDGTGSDGQNQSADNGAGESAEKGKGNNSPNAGKDAKSKEKTGSSDGKTPGEGSQQRDGAGDKPGRKEDSTGKGEQQAKQGDKETGKQGEKEGGNQTDKQDGGKQGDKTGEQKGDKAESKQGEKPEGKLQQDSNDTKGKEGGDNSAAGGSANGGGQPGGAANMDPSITGEAPAGDAANLEYARKQTDLVLDKLSDQLKSKKPDDKLLKELGWSEAEMRRFVERWQQRRDAANSNDPSAEAAKRELDDALRSLGLQRDKLQQGAVKKDTLRDVQQGYHGAVPAEYQERLKAYNQGVSRARPSGE